jgi:uncharacterized MAPEG superfamily protein
MTTDLQYLACTALLTASLWIPYIVCQSMTNGVLAPQNYADPAPRPVPLWGQRANRAHINAVEAFAPFAALILIAQVAGKADATTAFCAIAFFCSGSCTPWSTGLGSRISAPSFSPWDGLSSLCFSCRSCGRGVWRLG